MSHEVESMFSVKETPWHGLGKIVSDAPDTQTAINMAGLNWTVIEKPLYVENQDNNDFDLVPTHKGLYRSDNDFLLSVQSNKYTPVQNHEAFKFFDDFIEIGEASYQTAGSLRQGKTIWILAKINRDPIVVGKNDVVDKYLLLSNGHDGLMAVRVGFTPIRVVCANTLAMALNRKTKLLRINHRKNVLNKLDEVRQTIDLANREFDKTADVYKKLAKKQLVQADVDQYIKAVFKISEKDNKDRARHAENRQIEDIQRLFETGYGSDLKSSQGTYWGLYNAVTQYLSYERGRDKNSRLNSLWFGNSHVVNSDALNVAIKMAVG